MILTIWFLRCELLDIFWCPRIKKWTFGRCECCDGCEHGVNVLGGSGVIIDGQHCEIRKNKNNFKIQALLWWGKRSVQICCDGKWKTFNGVQTCGCGILGISWNVVWGLSFCYFEKICVWTRHIWAHKNWGGGMYIVGGNKIGWNVTWKQIIWNLKFGHNIMWGTSFNIFIHGLSFGHKIFSTRHLNITISGRWRTHQTTFFLVNLGGKYLIIHCVQRQKS